MKIKEGFVLREVAGNFVVVAVGKTVKDFSGVINLNDTGAFLWKMLSDGAEVNQMVDALLKEYEGVDRETAENDVNAFVNQLRGAQLLG